MDGWIVIPNWEKFQHYRDRRPAWIKLYTDLPDRDEWLSLTGTERGLLVTIWLAYGRSNGQLKASLVPSLVPSRVRLRHIQRLVDAGWIAISASKPLALRYQNASLETEKELKALGEPVENPKSRQPSDARLALLSAAVDIAANWNGADSVAFDEQLAEVERQHGKRLTVLEREKLWNQAFGWSGDRHA